MQQFIKYILVTSIFVILLFSIAFSAPPPGADPALAPFYHDLKEPGTGMSCCSESDCRPVEYRITSKGYEAFVTKEQYPFAKQDEWVEIPADKILSPRPNPESSAILCWTPWMGVMCFLPGYGT